MKLTRFMLSFAAAALLANAASYRLTILQPSVIAGQTLKPGDYKIDIDGNNATIRQGKTTSVSVPVSVEPDQNKFQTTTIRYNTEDGNFNVKEIHLGGTKLRIKVESGGSNEAGQQ
jgi:hypothetical protein